MQKHLGLTANTLASMWRVHETMRRLAKSRGVVSRSGLWSGRMNLDCGGFEYKAEECRLSFWERLGATENYRSHTRKPVFQQEAGLSFLLQLGCEELTASCKMRWPCSLPLWNSHTGRAALPSSCSSFCQETSPGAWVYSSKLCRMWIIVPLWEEKPVFQFFSSFLFPSTLVSSP